MSREVFRARWGMVVVLLAVGALAGPALYGQTKPVELDVPFVPTQTEAVNAMLKLAKVTNADYVFDLGCGDGRIVVAAAKDYKARAFGVDLDPQRIRESNENATKAGVTDLVKFKLADIMVTDVREASVVTLFLLESVNHRLRPRQIDQLKPGTRVVSNGFSMSDWKGDKVVRDSNAYGGVMYLWIVPAPAGGTWKWKTKTSADEVSNGLKLEQQFQVLSGAVSFPASGDVSITDATLEGKQIRFTATPKIADKEVKIVYQGTVEGDAIQGKQEWQGGASPGTYPWTATRDRLDVTGRWQISAPERPDSSGTLSILRKEGSLVATYARGEEPKKEVSLPALYVWGSSIRFEIPSDGSPLVFTGSLSADAGAGTISGDSGDKKAWTAKRLPSK